MPVPHTFEDFVELGVKSGLLEKSGADTVLEELHQTDSPGKSVRALAEAFIRKGMLTPFQADKLLTGRWRGFIIAGKYRLLERLGAGGMGAVYLCEHILMSRRVALKVLPLDQAADPASLARFYREARAVARLDHPNIVRAHDIDREDKLHFLVLEYIDGCNLHDFVRRNGPMSPGRAAHYLRQAALGLQHAHEAGLVHRDIKPGNLLLDRQGTIKILDMGLARFFDDDGTSFVKQFEEGFIIGTADYLAPEQTFDNRVDIRADIYSLGGTLYFLLTGKSPFQDGNTHQKMIWHQVRMPRPIRQLRSDVSEGLATILQTMLAKDPRRRFQTPGELADALAAEIPDFVPPPTAEELPPALPPGSSQAGSTATVQGSSTPPAGAPVSPRSAPRG